jgi:hypothetical protein
MEPAMEPAMLIPMPIYMEPAMLIPMPIYMEPAMEPAMLIPGLRAFTA